MDEKDLPTFDELDVPSEAIACPRTGSVATETLDLNALVLKNVTVSGSFDLRGVGTSSVGKLLQSVPILTLLVDHAGSIIFANQSWEKVGSGSLIHRTVFSVFPRKQDVERIQTIVKSVFLSRKPQVMEAELAVGEARLWGRIHARSLRLGDDRLVLLLIEDLTLEKNQLEMKERHAVELEAARADLERRVVERTAELTAANRRLQMEIAERERAEAELRKAHDQLERRVEERTAELRTINEQLSTEITSRTNAERALIKSQEKFRTIFQHSLDVIIIVDSHDGKILAGNRALKTVLGFIVGELMGKHYSVLFPEERDGGDSDLLDSVRKYGAVFEAKNIVHSDGKISPMDVTATIIPWGRRSAALVTFRDVSDREAALQALRESEERYRALFEQASTAIFLENEREEILDANPAASRLVGYSHEQLLKMRTSDLQPPLEHLLPVYANPDGSTVSAIETSAVRQDGGLIPIEITIAPLKTGGRTLFLSMVRDMTDRKRAEALTLAQRDLSMQLNSVTALDDALQLCLETALQVSGMDCAGVYLVGDDGDLALTAHTGILREIDEEVCRVSPDSPQAQLIMAGSAIYTNYADLDTVFRPFDERQNLSAMAILPIHHEGRVIACFHIASRTIDDTPVTSRNALEAIAAQVGTTIARLKAEEALREAYQELEQRVDRRTSELRAANQRLEEEAARREQVEEQIRSSLNEKEVLLSEVHHRVKNNLQIICSLLGLQCNYVRDDKVLGALTDSQNRIKSMALIHEQLYQSDDLARINFSKYLESLAGALANAFADKARSVAIKTRVDPVFLEVGMALPCGLITNELVTNCLKHAFPEGRTGEVVIEFSRPQVGGYILSVADNGIGLPDGFDVRAASSLGLQLVKNLTELQLRGKLEVFRDHGTVFRMEIPDRTRA